MRGRKSTPRKPIMTMMITLIISIIVLMIGKVLTKTTMTIAVIPIMI